MAIDVDTFETNRVVLRGLNETDTDDIVEWRSDYNVYRFFKYPHRLTAEEHLNWYHNNYLNNKDRYDWICIEKKSNEKIGVFGLIRSNDSVELNFLLKPEAQHKGYAVEIIERLIQYANSKWKSEHFVSVIHKDNAASINLIKRLHFEMESTEDDFEIWSWTGKRRYL